MTTERDRLEDLNIQEAAGRSTPPDLTARILNAAGGKLEDAPTPISGAHSVPHSARPQGRRHTAAVPRRNWQGAGIVAAFTMLFAIGLTVFLIWKDPETTNQQDTAEQRQANETTSPSPSRERWSPAPANNQLPEPQPQPEPPVEEPEPEPDDNLQPEPKPDDTPDQPKPEPKPDDTVEDPKPEDTPVQPQPDDTVRKPKPDDPTTPVPLPGPVYVAWIGAEGRGTLGFGAAYLVRVAGTNDWLTVDDPKAKGVKLDAAQDRYWLQEGVQLKFKSREATLSNGAQLYLAGEAAIFSRPEGLRIELLDDDLYVDNQRTGSTLRVTRGDATATIGEGAGVFETSRSKLDVFCVDGTLSIEGTTLDAGYVASHGTRGWSKPKEAGRADWNHPLLAGAPLRRLGAEEFEVAPAGRMIQGKLETRTAAQLESELDGHVASDTGREAAVGFGLDGGHKTLRGEIVRVRYRATGASKMVVQLFCPARNDNFGVDLAPGKEGEWHVLEVRFSDLRDRETHKDAPPPGTNLSSFTIAIEGKDDAQLEVDWVEFVREPRFGE
jgi:hypothetical protein